MMGKFVRSLLLGLGALVVTLPLLMTFFGSFMGKAELFSHIGPVLDGGTGQATMVLFPKLPTIAQYVKLLMDNLTFLRMFWNSVLLCVPTIFCQAVVATLCAWGFAHYRFKLSNPLFMAYIALMMMPFQVTLVPTYLSLERLNLIDTPLAIILPGIFSTFGVFLLRQFFHTVPHSLVEAARIDGAREGTIFLRVALPLAMPGVASMMVLSFLDNWNLIEQPMTFLKDQALHPLSLYLMRVGKSNADVALAASILTLLPALLLFFYCETYLVAGIALTGIKE